MHPKVVLALTVDPDGSPYHVRVKKGYSRELDRQALEAVKKWEFTPAKKDGRPVGVMIEIEVAFDCAQPNSCVIANPDRPADTNDATPKLTPPSGEQTLPTEPVDPGLCGVTITLPHVYPDGPSVDSPRVQHSSDPIYPASVQGISGLVVLQLVINEKGEPENIQVIKSLHPDLDKSAVEAVSRWKFFPTKVRGKLVKVQTDAAVKMQPPS